jgi:hypothetical protein
MFSILLLIFEEDFQTFIKFDWNANKLRSIEYQNFFTKVSNAIMVPLAALLNYLYGPNKLIDKRQDKLLDYEKALNTLETKKNDPYSISATQKEVNYVQFNIYFSRK